MGQVHKYVPIHKYTQIGTYTQVKIVYTSLFWEFSLLDFSQDKKHKKVYCFTLSNLY